jgi:hypothetical protein
MPRPLVLLLLGLACTTDEVVQPRPVCDPLVRAIDPAEGPLAGGTVVAVSGRWLHSDLGERDIVVRLAGVDAQVLASAEGEGCEPCLACGLDALRCDECDRVCAGEISWTDPSTQEVLGPSACVDTVTIRTPAGAAPGAAALTLQNVHGGATGPSFHYLAP